MRRMFVMTMVLAVVLVASAGAQAGRLVRLELRDGSSKVVRLDGVGCDESICSRVAVNSRAVGNVIADRTRFDAIAAVREIAGNSAVFVMKDGSARQVSVIPDNRVLYVMASNGRTQKIALGELRSIDFNPRDAQ